jgi:hypothetical protein
MPRVGAAHRLSHRRQEHAPSPAETPLPYSAVKTCMH